MINESVFSSSLIDLKHVLLEDVTILHLASVYILMYVIYKALGRYVYFKPQEHASKVNRTFLVLSVLIVWMDLFRSVITYLPFLPEYRWAYALCSIIIFLAPLSILMNWIVWKYDDMGSKSLRVWTYDYSPIRGDYYRAASGEVEGVQTTSKNIHSDALLNFIALVYFVTIIGKWALESEPVFGWMSYTFFITISVAIIGIYLDSAVFSWIKYLEKKRPFYSRRIKLFLTSIKSKV